jgi:hypothetical protein
VNHISETHFGSIESSHEYLALLNEVIEENRLEVEALILLASAENANRRKEALQLVSYNLTKLSKHMIASQRILNDLRSLRRLFHDERKPVTSIE